MPGLAANPKIFRYLRLPNEHFQLHFLTWLLPLSEKETLPDYAKRMAALVVEENAVLIGVSFGGILVQEMSKHIKAKKVIVISSVKSSNELPTRLKIIRKTKTYKLFPSKALINIEKLSAYIFGDSAKKRIKLYNEYLSVRDEKYLKWAIYNVLHWQQKTPLKNILHIHGTTDAVFPFKNIKNCVAIEKGSHIMILNKAKAITKIITKALL